MSADLPFPDDIDESKDGWTKYSTPIEQDGHWTVKITDTRKPDWEQTVEFASEEEGNAYIKKNILGKALKSVETKAKETSPAAPAKRKGNYVNANYKIIELTPQQKEYVRANWDKKDLKTLTQETFQNESLNGHNTEAKSIKAYIATLSVDGKEVPVIKTTKYTPHEKIELSQEQIDSIVALLNSPNPPKLNELVKLHFPDVVVVKPTSREYKAVFAFVKEYNEAALDMWDEPNETADYKAPTSIMQMVGRVNGYVSNPLDPGKNAYKGDALKPFDYKCLYALMGYVKSVSFRYQAQQYTKKMERTLFESHFITLTHDKPDLTSADQNLYIQASAAKVKIAQTERRLQKVIQQMDEQMETTDDKGRAAISMNMVELVNGTQEKLDKCVKEYQSLVKTLESTRAEREDLKTRRSESVLPLLEAWQKDEDARKGLIKQGQAEHEADEKEFERLSTFDSVVALIAGQSKNEAIRGA